MLEVYALDSCPIRAHNAFQNDELCKNRSVSERRGREEQQNGMKIMCFLNLKLCEHRITPNTQNNVLISNFM